MPLLIALRKYAHHCVAHTLKSQDIARDKVTVGPGVRRAAVIMIWLYFGGDFIPGQLITGIAQQLPCGRRIWLHLAVQGSEVLPRLGILPEDDRIKEALTL